MANATRIPVKSLPLLTALCIAALPATATAENLATSSQTPTKQDGITSGRPDTGGGSYGDRNRGGRNGFYSYSSHGRIDGSGTTTLDRKFSSTDSGTAAHRRNIHGSAYYGRNYGAPYFGGGYYDDGVHYRERRGD